MIFYLKSPFWAHCGGVRGSRVKLAVLGGGGEGGVVIDLLMIKERRKSNKGEGEHI